MTTENTCGDTFMNIYSTPYWLLPSEHYFGELRAVEVRGGRNPYRDPKTGRYTNGPKKSKLTKGKKRGKIKSQQFITKSEKNALSSAILTDHPDLPCDGTIKYKCWRGCTYAFIVKGYGEYKIVGKYIIKGRER